MSDTNDKNPEPTSSSNDDYKVQLEKERNLRQQQFAELTDYKKQHETLQSNYERLQDEIRQMRLDSSSKSGDNASIEEIKSQISQELTAQWGSKLESLEADKTSAEKELTRYRVESPMLEMMAHFQPGSHDLLKSLIHKHCKYKDGAIVIVGDDGKPMTGSKPGLEMSAGEWVKSVEDKYPFLVQASSKNGYSQTGQKITSNGRSLNLAEYERLTPSAQKEYLSGEGGQARARELLKQRGLISN
ncbi:MAG: hypothetical protein KC483_10205 [Nitrosarchaeum sp.]|nr:hypothetical protein [Nitrosarchaeum sp.]